MSFCAFFHKVSLLELGLEISLHQEWESGKSGSEVLQISKELSNILTNRNFRRCRIEAYANKFLVKQVGLDPFPQFIWFARISQVQEANTANVWGILVIQQEAHLPFRASESQET
jgi:hypothetical protein